MRWTIYQFGCDGCASKGEKTIEEIRFPVYPGEAWFKCDKPGGWELVDGKHYCPKHHITITVDDEIIRNENPVDETVG